MNHLEYDWESPVCRHLWRGLARDYTLIRYDARGNGLSDWEVDELSLDAWVTDLETVVNAVGVKHFPLLGFRKVAPFPWNTRFATRSVSPISFSMVASRLGARSDRTPKRKNAMR